MKYLFYLKKIEYNNFLELDGEYTFNGSLLSQEGEKIFLNNIPMIINPDDYIFLKKNQELIFNFEDVLKIFNSVYIIKEPKVPFPQADIFDVFVQICEKLYQHKSLTKSQIMELFELNPRQYSFYISAGEYLGLINKNRSLEKSLSQIGLGIFSLDIKHRNLGIVKLILQHKPFHDVFALYLDKKKVPNRDEIFEVLKKNTIYNVNSDVTLKRRATSVKSWIRWIVNLYDD